MANHGLLLKDGDVAAQESLLWGKVVFNTCFERHDLNVTVHHTLWFDNQYSSFPAQWVYANLFEKPGN